MPPRDLPAATLMRQAQDAPDRLTRKRRAQTGLDEATWAAIDAARGRMVPPMSENEWIREAIREKLEREA